MCCHRYFVEYYAAKKSFIVQLIVSRSQRFAATAYSVKPIRADAPDRVTPTPTYWSFNYSNIGVQRFMLWLMFIFGALTLRHDGRHIWPSSSHFCRWLQQDNDIRLKRQHVGLDCLCYPCTVLINTICHHEVLKSARREPYVYMVQLPAILLPVLLEIIKPFMELPTWSFWVAFTEMLMSIRLLHEGTVFGPLRRLVAIIDEAWPHMLALVAVLIPLAALTSLMHSQACARTRSLHPPALFPEPRSARTADVGTPLTAPRRTTVQLFGLFDDGFADPMVSLSRIVNMLTAPPPQSNFEGTQMEAQRQGSELLFYWSTIVIRLCFGSFIVAILVGAFNKVIASEAAEREAVERDASLPPDYVDCSKRSIGYRLWVFGRYVASGHLYGIWGPELIDTLEGHVAVMEAEDVTGAAAEEQLMLSPVALSQLVGDATAAELLSAFGAKSLQGDELWVA